MEIEQMKRAFTLFEMLVVIGILGILVGAACSAFDKRHKPSRSAYADKTIYEDGHRYVHDPNCSCRKR